MIQVGQKLPDATFRVLTAEGPKELSTADVFGGKKVVLVAVVGAYTGTCNNDHIPTYLEHADAIKAKGVADIVVVAINDPFVMDAWAKSTGGEGRITFLSDGNGEFSGALGATFDGSGFGLGTRSLRYAAVVDNGTVSALEVEESPGTCSVSAASSILKSL